jgi:hypothetical protein
MIDWHLITSTSPAPKDRRILLCAHGTVLFAKWDGVNWWKAMIDDSTEALDGNGTWCGPNEHWSSDSYLIHAPVTHWADVPEGPN